MPSSVAYLSLRHVGLLVGASRVLKVILYRIENRIVTLKTTIPTSEAGYQMYLK